LLPAAVLPALLVGLLAPAPAADTPAKEPAPPPALHIRGTHLVDARGKTVVLRGVNLGTWLAVEPTFTGLAFRDEKSLWADLERRFGADKAREIREAYRTAWVTAEDFRRVHDLGLNHVRVPFWYGLLEDDAHPGKYLDDGWRWLDRVVEWSEKAGLYCVLDLHGAPGGQSKEAHTGERERNAFWSDPALQKRTAALWAAVARRYKGRAAVAAFDLLNEPMGAPDGRAAVTAQGALAHAVRQADPGRLVIVEDGYKGLSSLPRLDGRDKAGVIYSQHCYATLTVKEATPKVHEDFLRERFPAFAAEQARFDQPLYVGEWNVIQEAAGGGPMAGKYVDAMDDRGWSWALWLYKQADKNPVHECWSLYRNDKALDLPDFERDSADQILTKLGQLGTENMIVFEPLRRAVGADRH
jgi:glucan 1,3-beta-glucosidase